MAIAFKKEEKKQKVLVYALAGIFLLTLLVLWQGFLKKALVVEKIIPSPVFEPKEVKINFKIFDNEKLKSLQEFEKIPPLEGEVGRSNPFVPY